ncbi:glycosyltransferase family 4 protein [Phytoactinopolyspora alkaliphila]|uniref:Glycosyltransferase family 4 protein n=1 Tax=Phytoactinopolyspora alkaliphila TaxID=1783498 RepID=A0A6N9YQE0_9ACTN|nr:glycosyltransferase family 4 protein [Phytoactinopolyspora alkaliphila]NED97150.1 glycosyltransferase family 4 protein [Phytoactinopolyspora alkaliphila]
MTSRTMQFDVLMATDCRFPGGNTSSVVEEIEAQYRAGYRTGILHLPSPVLNKPRSFAPKLRKVLDEGKAELVVGADRVEAGLLLVRHPTVFTEPPRDLPALDAEHVILAVNQVAADDRGVEPYYDIPHVHRQIERVVGKQATWAPIGPRVRESLEEHAASVPVLAWDWENVIDVNSWEVPRSGFVSDRPVIGRHSRGHWTKWPDTKQDILAAYPADPHYTVRILGGTDAPGQILERIPANWVNLPFNSVPAKEFLATIDFFVYFHHPGLIEAFGRVVLEALSAGTVVIAPPYLEPLFGDACLYGTPADVRSHVDRLYADWGAYIDRSQTGVELARKRFSYETHVERVAKLIGEPSFDASAGGGTTSSRTRRVASGVSAPALSQTDEEPSTGGRTLLLDLRWDTGDEPLLAQVIAEARTDAAGPTAVVVPAWRAGQVGDQANGAGAGRRGGRSRRKPEKQILVETFPWVLAELSAAERRRYVALRLSGLLATHRPERVVILDGGGRDARRVADAVIGSGIDVLLVHRDSATAGELGTAPEWVLPERWTVSRAVVTTAATAPSARTGWAAWRRKAPLWTRTRARRTMSALRRGRVRALERVAPSSGLMLFEVADAELALPVRAPVSHPLPERLPIALVVVTGADVEAGPTLQAVAERAQMTTAFRPAVLAPADWVGEATSLGITLETLIPEANWSTVYGGGWNEYVRGRVNETCQVIHPTTVVFAERTIHPAGTAGDNGASALLDVMEAARTRRRA